MENSYSFSSFNAYASNGISEALKVLNHNNRSPVIICIGSDLVLGDSLGPLVGTLLTNYNIDAYIYGTLKSPVTAKEVNCATKHVKSVHPNTITIAVDAAVGNEDDVGIIRVINGSLKPGLGVNKTLDAVGDISIIGVVSERSEKNYKLFNLTRLNLVYMMAEKIALGIRDYIISVSQPTYCLSNFRLQA
ncbi:MAG: spore protease YyaC [Clostridiales bacterium]|nr:spore protease YyaC [Clostridiales bacterium]